MKDSCDHQPYKRPFNSPDAPLRGNNGVYSPMGMGMGVFALVMDIFVLFKVRI
ncbi:hypothetical protein [Methanosarcina siciliae]|uniref:hypothetical protein n=1 Tax=Methanosarcina siciliae TaxID=38027 RepID=UPI0021C3F147|nr:hypothetical protein [Methanosarcina siciliae]